jgi:hypothetical protein
LYSACAGKYALTVPFAQRFFALAQRGDNNGDGAGYVGQITGNGFMKREFGKKLINEVFAERVDLFELVDAQGAYIPGHGTPPIILVGRNRVVSPRYSGTIRTIRGVQGEAGTPSTPAEAPVWRAIVNQIDYPGSESKWVSCADVARDQLATHPWSLSGGGATELFAEISKSSRALTELIAGPIGFASFPGQDDAFIGSRSWLVRLGAPRFIKRPLIIGKVVRDWEVREGKHALVPYGQDLVPMQLDFAKGWGRHLWTMRTTLGSTTGFGGQTRADSDEPWWTWYRWVPERYRTPLSITFAFVATHNHFVLDRGGKVFKQSAPVIKLPEGATEDDHLRLLGALNSSTACFWLKQVSQPKAGGGVGRGMQDEAWEERYEFTGTKLQDFPLPAEHPLARSRRLDRLAQRLSAVAPASVVASGVPTRERLDAARVEWHEFRAMLVAEQEELDWEVYRLYGLIDEDLTMADTPGLALGERAFEIALARSGARTEWCKRHDSTPITDLPPHWPDEYKALVERRIAVIQSDRNIALIERPECKRRWSLRRDKEPWDWPAQQATALRDWLLDRLEAAELWNGAPAPLSVAQLADRVRHDGDFRSVLDLWVGTDQHDLVKTLGTLFADEQVPFLPALRYRPSGLRKRAQWERTWVLQRREDAAAEKARLATVAASAAEEAWLAAEAAGEAERVRLIAEVESAMENAQQAEQELAEIDVPVPPKYTSADFVKGSYWRSRGELDVPKERFISYPGVGREGDGTLLLGWAGWDHLAQAQGLATVYLERKTQAAWPPEKLLPVLAGLAELEPWLRQWHAEPRPGFPGTPAEFFTGLIDTELAALGADRAKLTELRGVEELV